MKPIDLEKQKDDFLIELYKKGNNQVLEILYHRYFKYLHFLAHQIFDTYNAPRCIQYEDLFSEAIITFNRSLNTYIPGNDTYLAYLRKMVINHLKRYLKEEIEYFRISKVSLDDFVYDDNEKMTYSEILTSNQSESLKEELILEFNEKTFTSLTEKEEEVLRKRYQGMKIREIAIELNIEEYQVKYLIKKAKQKTTK